MKTADNYAAWQIDEKDFPKHGIIEEQIRFLIGYGILAPSTHNTQPWLFEVAGNRLILKINPSLMLPQADPSGRGLQISLGCCVANISVAAGHFGLDVDCAWSEAEVTLVFSKSAKIGVRDALFDGITKRYSAKLAYESSPLWVEHKSALLSIEDAGGSQLTLLTDVSDIQKAAESQRQATLDFAGNKAFFKELGQWLRATNTKMADGMPGFVVGATNAQSVVMKTVIPRFGPAVKIMAKKDASLVGGSSAVGFITTDTDTKKAWFDAGRHYELLALQATVLGISMTPLAAQIESSKARPKLSKVFSLPGKPQIFFRVGYSKHMPYHTPRRYNTNI